MTSFHVCLFITGRKHPNKNEIMRKPLLIKQFTVQVKSKGGISQNRTRFMKSICCCNTRISWSLHAGMRSVYEPSEAQEMIEMIILGIMVSGRHKVLLRSLRDRVRSLVIREELGVEPPLLCIERSQLRWFGHLVRMHPGVPP